MNHKKGEIGVAAAFTAGALLLGMLAGLWVTVRLDPDGTGGSVLAMPAILSVTVASLLFFFSGLAFLWHRGGKWMMLSSIITPATFLAWIVISR